MPSRLSVVWSPSYEVDIGPHVFPTAKYRLVRASLLERGVLSERDFLPSHAATDEDLLRVHTTEYLRKIREDDFTVSERLGIEVPFTPAVAEAMRLCCGGTLMTARMALREGVAVHLGGGFHHAFPNHGEGFCLLNDVAVAAEAMLAEHAVDQVMVVDLDVHHGNGTAAIFAGDERVFTLSMHQENNYPADKPPSDLDLGLADRIGDDDYLALLEEHLAPALDRHRPGLVLYLAGADPYRGDQLGGLALTIDGLRQRDRMVLRTCQERGVCASVLLAGGYASRTDDTVRIHANTVEVAVACTSTDPDRPPTDGGE